MKWIIRHYILVIIFIILTFIIFVKLHKRRLIKNYVVYNEMLSDVIGDYKRTFHPAFIKIKTEHNNIIDHVEDIEKHEVYIYELNGNRVVLPRMREFYRYSKIVINNKGYLKITNKIDYKEEIFLIIDENGELVPSLSSKVYTFKDFAFVMKLIGKREITEYEIKSGHLLLDHFDWM
jgi:hypothetical protein